MPLTAVLFLFAVILSVLLAGMIAIRLDHTHHVEVWGTGEALEIRAEIRRIRMDRWDTELYVYLQQRYPDLSGLLSREGLVNYHLNQLRNRLNELEKSQ